eukprot:CFRG5746T1
MSPKEITLRLTNINGQSKTMTVSPKERLVVLDLRLGGGHQLFLHGKALKNLLHGTLSSAGVCDNDEIFLIKKRSAHVTSSITESSERAPSKDDIYEVTKDLPEPTGGSRRHTEPETNRNSLRQLIYTCLAVAHELQNKQFNVDGPDDVEIDPDFDPFAHVDERAQETLESMGFSTELARKALALNRGSPMLAVEWIMEQEDGFDGTVPLLPHQIKFIRKQISEVNTSNTAATANLLDMGFHPADVAASLAINRNNPSMCVEWLLRGSHEADLFDEDWNEGNLNNKVTVLSPEDPLVMEILDDHRVRETLTTPRALTVFREIYENLSAVTRYLPDPDLGPVLVFITRTAQNVA